MTIIDRSTNCILGWAVASEYAGSDLVKQISKVLATHKEEVSE
jgi:hypothetical protein